MKHEDIKEDAPLIKKIAKKEVKSHEKKMHGMKKGGVTGESMRKYGRNMARVMNQKSAGRGR
jgi:hypothetical protein